MTLKVKIAWEVHKFEKTSFMERNVNTTAAKILSLVRSEMKKCVPASNRKSCEISDHYFSRYKEGHNSCRQQMLKRIERRCWGEDN